MQSNDYKAVVGLLTELLWIRATATSFIPEGAAERKPFEKRIGEIKRLRALCEVEALKAINHE